MKSITTSGNYRSTKDCKKSTWLKKSGKIMKRVCERPCRSWRIENCSNRRRAFALPKSEKYPAATVFDDEVGPSDPDGCRNFLS
jgi:hypothetical protein